MSYRVGCQVMIQDSVIANISAVNCNHASIAKGKFDLEKEASVHQTFWGAHWNLDRLGHEALRIFS
jgi:hypothetical protein